MRPPQGLANLTQPRAAGLRIPFKEHFVGNGLRPVPLPAAPETAFPDMVGPVKGYVLVFWGYMGNTSSERGEVLGGMVGDGGSA